ncbi:MAG: SDR family oxidoreductase [Clostridiaceae bacterium]
MGKFLVTGSTGNIGRYVVDELISLNKEVKVAVHNISKGNNFFQDKEVEMVKFDFLETSTFENALDAVEGIFLVRPPKLANPEKDMLPFLKAAKKIGVKKIVFISLLGVEKNPIVPHRKIEKIIKESGIPYCFLRPSFFMQNLNTNHREEIRERDELFIPVGKAKTSFIDTRDIAVASAVTLIDEKFNNSAFTLTGKEAIDYYEVAKIITEVIGRKIEYKNPGFFKFRKYRINYGTPKEFANVMMFLYLMTKLGTAKDITDDLEKIIGREPITFKQYVINHADYWK